MAKQAELPSEYRINIINNASDKLNCASGGRSSFDFNTREKIQCLLERLKHMFEVEVEMKNEKSFSIDVVYYDDLSGTIQKNSWQIACEKIYSDNSPNHETFTYHVKLKGYKEVQTFKSDFKMSSRALHEALDLAKLKIGEIHAYESLANRVYSWQMKFKTAVIQLSLVVIIDRNNLVQTEIRLSCTQNNDNSEVLQTVYEQLRRIYTEKKNPIEIASDFNIVAKYFAEKEKLTAEFLAEKIKTVFGLHNEKAKKPEKAFRKWDGKTPYGVHPTWGAMTILHEPQLPERLRRVGALTLLGHDVIEDTTAHEIQTGFGWPQVVINLIQQMTFESFYQETQLIWNMPIEIKLFKLYDKVSNLMDADAWMEKEKLEAYKKYTLELTQAVKKHFPKLNIIKLAEALCQA